MCWIRLPWWFQVRCLKVAHKISKTSNVYHVYTVLPCLQASNRKTVCMFIVSNTGVGWGLPDLDSGITSHHVHSFGCSLIFFIYLTSHQPTSPSARAMQQPRDKNGIITINFKTPFPLHFHLSQVFLVPTSLMLFPHPNSQKKKSNWPTCLENWPTKQDWTHQVFPTSPPNAAHSNSCGSSLQNCFGSSSGSADLNGWWCPWLGQQYQWWGISSKRDGCTKNSWTWETSNLQNKSCRPKSQPCNGTDGTTVLKAPSIKATISKAVSRVCRLWGKSSNQLIESTISLIL